MSEIKLKLQPAPQPRWYYLIGPFPAALRDLLRDVPGVRFDRGAYVLPENMIQRVMNLASRMGWRLINQQRRYGIPASSLSPRLYEPQRARAMHAAIKRRMHFNHQMRTGKTPTAIETVKAVEAALDKENQHTLILGPAASRPVWRAHLAEWWPDAQVSVVTPGKPTLISRVTFCSYDMLVNLPRGFSWTHVILDESHMLTDSKAQRTRLVRNILSRQDPDGLRLLMTGTPQANDTDDLFSQFDLLDPGSVGRLHEFKQRYMIRKTNQYAASGFSYEGLKQEHAEELADRFAGISTTLTQDELAIYMPPLTIDTMHLDAPRQSVAEALAAFKRLGRNGGILELSRAKLKQLREVVEHELESHHRVMVLTHLQDTAESLAVILRADALITGATAATPEKRAKILAKVRPIHGVTAATYHSLLQSIALPEYTRVLYAEIPWTPKDLEQSAQRYRNPGGTERYHVSFAIIPGTPEETIAERVAAKIRASVQTTGGTTERKASSTALDSTVELTDDELMQMFSNLEGVDDEDVA